jgi:hypothetical protein
LDEKNAAISLSQDGLVCLLGNTAVLGWALHLSVLALAEKTLRLSSMKFWK